jgi:transposase
VIPCSSVRRPGTAQSARARRPSARADHRRALFGDELFADLFPSGRGRPSIPADVIATVMVLQALEGLSDRDAARALRDRISWKVAAGLALDDEGFDYSVLTYWRSRLRRSDRPERIFDAVRSVVAQTGVLKEKSRRALDSTLLDDAVATQDTVTQLISAIRRARRMIPAAADVAVVAHDYDRAGKPAIAWDDPIAKAALITGLVNDAPGTPRRCPPPPTADTTPPRPTTPDSGRSYPASTNSEGITNRSRAPKSYFFNSLLGKAEAFFLERQLHRSHRRASGALHKGLRCAF